MATQNNNTTIGTAHKLELEQEQDCPLSPAHLNNTSSPHIKFVTPMASKHTEWLQSGSSSIYSQEEAISSPPAQSTSASAPPKTTSPPRQQMKPAKSRSPSPYPRSHPSLPPASYQGAESGRKKVETQHEDLEKSCPDLELGLQSARQKENMQVRRKKKWDRFMISVAVLILGGLGVVVLFWFARRK